jgi:hypothetical protein
VPGEFTELRRQVSDLMLFSIAGLRIWQLMWLGIGVLQGSAVLRQCQRCAAGSASTNGSLPLCNACPAGLSHLCASFSPWRHALSGCFNPCRLPTSVDLTSACMIVFAIAGSFGNATGATRCYTCSPGFFSPASGSTGSQQCAAGASSNTASLPAGTGAASWYAESRSLFQLPFDCIISFALRRAL